MNAALNSTLVSALEAAAAQAGLVLVTTTEGSDFHGQPTAVFLLGLAGADAGGRTLRRPASAPSPRPSGGPGPVTSSCSPGRVTSNRSS